jgi:hypothetical protein
MQLAQTLKEGGIRRRNNRKSKIGFLATDFMFFPSKQSNRIIRVLKG